MKTLAVLTNGGDTCVLNASIKSIRDNAYKVGYKKIYGILRGYQGLLDGWIIDITHREIDVRIGGSFLGSMRESPTKKTIKGYCIDKNKCERMAANLTKYNIDVLVVIGGDGTLQATQHFQTWVHGQVQIDQEKYRRFELLGFLKTIDNDIRTLTTFEGIEMALCPGFPSAVKKIVSTVEDLRVTATTAQRAFAIEVMGRDAGWLAAAGTFGGAEVLLVPEIKKIIKDKHLEDEDFEIWKKLAQRIIIYYHKNRNVMVAVGEGFQLSPEYGGVKIIVDALKNLYGPRKKVGATEFVALVLSPVLRYYFWCVSTLGEMKFPSVILRKKLEESITDAYESKESDVLNFMEKVYGLCEKNEDQPSKEKDSNNKNKNHPLRKWNIHEYLINSLSDNPSNEIEIGYEKWEIFYKKLVKDFKREQPNKTKKDIEEKHQTKSGAMLETFSTLSTPPHHFEIRPHRTDYVPRSGEPSPYDYKLVSVLGEKIGEMLSNNEFGAVPSLDKIVPYEELEIDKVKTVPIQDIRTKLFDSEDYFNFDTLQVSNRITDFFRTITSGPETLNEAIEGIDKGG